MLYDFTASEPTRASFGLDYETDCIRVGLKATSRFADTAALDPTTEYSLTLALGAFDKASRCAVGR